MFRPPGLAEGFFRWRGGHQRGRMRSPAGPTGVHPIATDRNRPLGTNETCEGKRQPKSLLEGMARLKAAPGRPGPKS